MAWIEKEKIKNEKGEPIEFARHYFLLDLYTDKSKEIAIKKGSQVGVSTFAILKEIHDTKYWGINQIHTLPSDKDTWEFVPTKVDGIIKANGITLAKDSTEIKGIGKGFIYYKGTFSEKAPIIISSDRNIYDEVDKSRQDVIRDFTSRLSFSTLREKIYLSTPTIPNYGIDALFNRSDQKHWRFNCPHCGFRQHMEWEKNVDLDLKKYVCQKCHKEITIDDMKQGNWEARFPSREMSGYWIPQMLARPAAELIKELEDAEDDQYFYNFVLGLAYLNPESKISASLILKNLTAEKSDERNSAMGVDVGEKELHVIVGNEKGVFGIARIEDQPGKTKWDRLGELMEVYEVRCGLVDALPSKDEALEFARKYPYKVYLHFHKSDLKEMRMVKFMDEGKFTDKQKDFEEEIKVFSDINRVQDATINDLTKGKIRFNFQVGDKRIAELIEHTQTMYRRTVTDKFQQEHYEWASTNMRNHLWDALCEFKIALDRLKKDNA